MYKNLEVVYVDDIKSVKARRGNQLCIDKTDNKKYIFNANTGLYEELGSSGSSVEEKDPIWEREKDNYYPKTEVDSKLNVKANTSDVYKKDEVYSKTGVDERLEKKADVENVYSKGEVDESQKVQDDRIKALEDGGGTPSDSYTKTEADAKFATINDTYTKAEVYKKDEVYSKNGVDTKLNDKTDVSRTSELENNLANNYRKIVDQDFIDNELNEVDKKLEARIEALEKRASFPGDAIATINNADLNANQEPVILNYKENPFYTNNEIFKNTISSITNTNTSDNTNPIGIIGRINLKTDGNVQNAKIEIKCSEDTNTSNITTLNMNADDQILIPFNFVLPGDTSTIELTVQVNGRAGMMFDILPTYVYFRKLR